MNLGIPIASGNTAEIFLHEDKIIKVFNERLPCGEATYEAGKQKLAYSTGLPVPKILDVEKIDGKQALIMEYVKGKTLGELISDSPGDAGHYMDLSVDIQLKIHSMKVDTLEPMKMKLANQIDGVGELSQRLKEVLIERLDEITFEERLCHGDLHLNNLIMSEDGSLTIIDWIDSSSGDIRADAYRTYLLYSQVSLELAELYLRLYCQKSGLSKEEIFIWAPIIAGARLSESVSTENSQRLLAIVNKYCP
ncbi:phosphotransferase family protein [Rossellomorea aquimaris]|jgi:aminoglycoside phosphotransferase (APT) family kinase protein|uniref:Aminoglycoside phosphotransferase n=1 Tax=Rossellomorea aquimaris TaxID=189382 RepID=A0A1J6W5A6_9BACI|nr:aminoglycoside phosphotransferase family protein [Rossellomorea aquimaris]OIU71812.1 aminoglycoside phosphotransferase [Rossellomorea aquimaris]